MIEKLIVNGEEYLFTCHALTVILERELSIKWIEATLISPEKTEMDNNDIELLHALKRIVTTYFDRGQKNHL